MNRTGNSRIAVVGWGRGMGHKGHMYLASSVITQAKRMNADPYFFVSKTVGKDDPLYPEEKVAIYQHVFPQEAQIFMPQGNLNKALEEVAQLGYEGVVVVVGADQKEAFQYLEKPTKQGIPVYQSLGFKKLKVISRQETGDESAALEGPRATPMREILLNPDATDEDKFKVWRDAMPDALGDREVTDLMHKAEGRLMGSNPKKLKEARIFDPKARVNLYYHSPKTGNYHVLAHNIPMSVIDKYLQMLWDKGYDFKPSDIVSRPVDYKQYTRSSQPSLAEGEHERLLAHDIAISLHTIKPDIFTRFGDEYILSLIDKCINDRPNGHKLEIMTDVMKHLTHAVKTGELYEFAKVKEGKFNELSVMISDYYNMEISDVKFYGMYGITRQQFAKDYAQYLEEDQQLDEFAPSDAGGNDGFSEETLKMLASQWYNGDEDPRVERTLMAAGWEIGQDEGYDDEPGVFVVQSGDTNGDSYLSWPAHELRQPMNEDYLDE